MKRSFLLFLRRLRRLRGCLAMKASEDDLPYLVQSAWFKAGAGIQFWNVPRFVRRVICRYHDGHHKDKVATTSLLLDARHFLIECRGTCTLSSLRTTLCICHILFFFLYFLYSPLTWVALDEISLFNNTVLCVPSLHDKWSFLHFRVCSRLLRNLLAPSLASLWRDTATQAYGEDGFAGFNSSLSRNVKERIRKFYFPILPASWSIVLKPQVPDSVVLPISPSIDKYLELSSFLINCPLFTRSPVPPTKNYLKF